MRRTCVSCVNTQELLDTHKRFLRLMRSFNAFTPKFHMMYHVVQRSLAMGNPLTYAVFYDEGLNKTLKQALRNCHQLAFEHMAMVKMAEVLDRAAAKRKR